MDAEEVARNDRTVRDGLADTIEGVCTAVDLTEGLVTISIGGAPQVMRWAGGAPWPGDSVRVVYAGKTPICIAIDGASQGTVASVTGDLAKVTGDDGKQYEYPFVFGSAPSTGHRVVLDHRARLVGARYSQEPPGSLYGTGGGPPASSSGSATFRPSDSASFYNGGFEKQQVEVGDSRTGVYYYGSQIADSIPDSAVITRAELQLAEIQDFLPSSPSLLGTHTSLSRGGEPGVAGSISVSDGGTVNIISLANALKTGAAYGVGFQKAAGGWRRFGAYDSSGTIYMEWS